MSDGPTVIVKKGGFFSSIVNGLFGLLITVVICATGIGVYALHVVDGKLDRTLGFVDGVITSMPEWQAALPPLLADAASDRRDIAYRDALEIKIDSVKNRRGEGQLAVLTVHNTGDESVSYMTVNLRCSDDRGVPVEQRGVIVATPLQIEDDWRGPLLAGETRQIVIRLGRGNEELKPAIELTDLRVFDPNVAIRRAAERDAARQREREAQLELSATAQAPAMPDRARDRRN